MDEYSTGKVDIPERYIEYWQRTRWKKSDRYDWLQGIWWNDEDISTGDIEVLKLVTLSSKRDIYNIKTEFDERNQINMIDDK